MSKKIRLRLHVETDLLGTRITPSPRLKDPCRAALPRPHQLSARQLELWQVLFPGQPPKSLLLERTPEHAVLANVLQRLPAGGRVSVVAAGTLEVTAD